LITGRKKGPNERLPLGFRFLRHTKGKSAYSNADLLMPISRPRNSASPWRISAKLTGSAGAIPAHVLYQLKIHLAKIRSTKADAKRDSCNAISFAAFA
jgi:hypothetical protein